MSKSEHLKAHQFQPGHPGGPGRKKGSRNQLGEDFIAALHADFADHGKEAIESVRKDKPDQYLKVIAMIVPKELHIKVDPIDEMSDEQLAAHIRQLSAALGAGMGIAPAPAPEPQHEAAKH